jgi:hypothetical protein
VEVILKEIAEEENNGYVVILLLPPTLSTASTCKEAGFKRGTLRQSCLELKNGSRDVKIVHQRRNCQVVEIRIRTIS